MTRLSTDEVRRRIAAQFDAANKKHYEHRLRLLNVLHPWDEEMTLVASWSFHLKEHLEEAFWGLKAFLIDQHGPILLQGKTAPASKTPEPEQKVIHAFVQDIDPVRIVHLEESGLTVEIWSSYQHVSVAVIPPVEFLGNVVLQYGQATRHVGSAEFGQLVSFGRISSIFTEKGEFRHDLLLELWPEEGGEEE